jgi:ribosomal protein S27AE
MIDDDNGPSDIIPFPKKKRKGDEGKMLEIVRYDGGCDHHRTTFRLRDGETELECARCGTKVDPMFVLRELANQESRWFDNRERYQDEMKRLDERKKTECEHCGRMTRISRHKPRSSR